MTDKERLDWLEKQEDWGAFHDLHRPWPRWKIGPVKTITLDRILGEGKLREAIDEAASKSKAMGQESK